MPTKINMRCTVCGNAVRVDRDADVDPPSAVECATNECNICEAASGGFEEQWHFDRQGRQVHIER